MGEELYDKEVARRICAQIEFGEYFDVRDDGVFIKEDFVDNDPGGRVFTWIPACAMESWPGAPNPLICPALPIPFTAKDLAAFMLTTAGSLIQETYGRIGGAPNEVALNRLGMRGTKVRMALRAAYDLARQAQSVVGALDHEEQQRAHDLLAAFSDALDQALEREKVMEQLIVGRYKNGTPEYADLPRDEYLKRLARAKKSIADQEAYATQVNATADAALAAWRNGMVHQLYRPPTATHSQALTDALDLSVGVNTESRPNTEVRKSKKTLAFEAEVIRLMDKFWNDRNLGTEPTKGDLCKLVFQEILRGPVRGERKTTQGMVNDAAKLWRHPIVLPAYVPPQAFKEKRHRWKGEK